MANQTLTPTPEQVTAPQQTFLERFRATYPAYKDWDDARLAEGLHKRAFSDIPRETFFQAVGYQPPPSIGEVAASGLERGWDQMQAIGGGGVAALAEYTGDLAGSAGFENVESFADRVSDWGMNTYFQNMGEARENPRAIADYTEIEDLGDLGTYAVQAISEQLPMFLPSLASGGIGGFIAKKAATKAVGKFVASKMAAGMSKQQAVKEAAKMVTRRTLYGATASGYPTAAGMVTGEVHGGIIEETGQSAPGVALTAGAAGGALEFIPSGMALKSVLGKEMAAEVRARLIKRIGFGATKIAMTESLTEGAQTVIEKAAINHIDNDKPIFSDKNVTEIVDSMATAFFAGGGLGVTSETAGAVTRRPLRVDDGEKQQDQVVMKDRKLDPKRDLTDAQAPIKTESEQASEQTSSAPIPQDGGVSGPNESEPLPASPPPDSAAPSESQGKGSDLNDELPEIMQEQAPETPPAPVATPAQEEDQDAVDEEPPTPDGVMEEPALDWQQEEILELEEIAKGYEDIGMQEMADTVREMKYRPKSGPDVLNKMGMVLGQKVEDYVKAGGKPAVEKPKKKTAQRKKKPAPVADKPTAAPGLTSYRYNNGDKGHVMIGAKDQDDAMREAMRSVTGGSVTVGNLEVWNGDKYVPVDQNEQVKKKLLAREKTKEVETAAAEVEAKPTEAQKEAGNYKKGHVNVHGLDVAIETPRGKNRTGKNPDGTAWSNKSPAHYGYIKRTEGADGEQVDVYVGPELEAETVFVVDQVDPETGAFDEHKAILGAKDRKMAESIYKRGFSDKSGAKRMGGVKAMSVDEFKAWLKDGKTDAPVAAKKRARKKAESKAADKVSVASMTRNEDFSETGNYTVKLSNGREWEVFRDTDQFSYPVWYGKPKGEKGEHSSIGFNKREALDAIIGMENTAAGDVAEAPAAKKEPANEPVEAKSEPEAAEKPVPEVKPLPKVAPPKQPPGSEDLLDIPDFLKKKPLTPEQKAAQEAEESAAKKITVPKKAEKKKGKGNIDAIMKAKYNDLVDRLAVDLDKERIEASEEALHTMAQKIHDKETTYTKGLAFLKAHPDGMIEDVKKHLADPEAADVPYERPDMSGEEVTRAIREEVTNIVSDLAPDARLSFLDDPYSEVEGDSIGDLIRVSLHAQSPAWTGRHEVIHYLRALGFFTEQEWKVLTAAARNKWHGQHKIAERYGDKPMSVQLEEAVAEEFARRESGARDHSSVIARAFKKLSALVRRLRNFVRGMGFQTADDVFDAVKSGSVGRREASVENPMVGVFEKRKHISTPDIDGMADLIGPKKLTRQQYIDQHGGWRGIWERVRNRFTEGTFDNLFGIRLMEEDIHGELTSDSSTASYKLARLGRGVQEFVLAAMLDGAPIWAKDDGGLGATAIDNNVKSFLEIVDDVGHENLRDFEVYMAARRAEETKRMDDGHGAGAVQRDDQGNIIKIGKEALFANYDTAGVIADMDAAYPEFAARFQELQDYNTAVLRFAKESGLLNDETFDYFMEAHQNYVPFHRILDQHSEARGKEPAGMGFSGQHPNFYELHGSDARIDHPLLNLERNLHQLMEASYKNVVMQTVVKNATEGVSLTGKEWMVPARKAAKKDAVTIRDMVEDLEDMGLDVASGTTNINDVDQSAIRVLWTLGHPPLGDNIVSVVKDGKPAYYEVLDPTLFRSITGLGGQVWGPNMKHIMFLPKLAKKATTMSVGMDPAFQIANFIRDTLHASVISHKGFVPFVDSFKGVIKSSAHNERMREYMAAGGGFASVFDPENPTMRSRIGEAMDDSPFIQTSAKTQKFIDTVLEIEGRMEYATRLGMFDKLRKQGVSLMEATYQSREISTDFGMRGNWLGVRLLAETVPFLNAGMQGLYRTYRGMREGGPDQHWLGVHKGVWIKGGALMAAAMLLHSYNMDDERYKELPEYEKDAYWNVFLPDSIADAMGTARLRVPKPFEMGVMFGTIPERAMTAVQDGEWGVFAARMMWNAEEMFRLEWKPQFIKPALGVWANYDDFREKSIIPFYLEAREPQDQWDDSTALMYRELGRMFKVSPKKAEAIAQGYGATMVTYLEFVVDNAILYPLGNYPTPEHVKWTDYPVMSRFFKDAQVKRTAYENRFYELKSQVDKTMASFNAARHAGDVNRVLEILEEDRDKLVMAETLKAFNEKLRQIKRAMRLIKSNPTMGAVDKREALDSLRKVSGQVSRAAETVIKRLEKDFEESE